MSTRLTHRLLQRLLMTATLVLLGSTPLAHISSLCAQGITTGVIVGTAVDASGAIISGANVTAHNGQTGTTLTSATDQAGVFSFRNVQVGVYTVAITAPGFEATTQSNVRVDTGQTNNLGSVKLGVGAASTSVQVSESTATLLQTAEAQVSTTFSTVQTEDLPLNGALDNIALLTPGVAAGHDDSFSNSNGNNLSINGNRSRSNNYEIDGQSNNDNSVGGPQIFFANQDAIQEIQVITSNFNAVYGRNMGGVVNYVTKTGTNRFHGSGYEFFSGNFLFAYSNGAKNPLLGYCPAGVSSSTGCTTPSMAHYVDNRYGATFGGPLLKDKVWFFGGTNFEHTRQGYTPYVTSSSTPTPTGLQQLATAFPGNAAVTALTNQGPYGVLANAHTSGATSTRNVTGPNGVTAAVDFAQVSTSVAPLYNDQEDLGRIDWQPRQQDHFFIRYMYQDSVSQGNLLSDGYSYNVPDGTHSIGGDWAHTFSSRWVNQLRYSFQQSKLFFQGGTQSNCVSTTLSDCNASISIQGGNVGLGYSTNLPQGRTVKVTQVQDNANWTHGNHSISFGGDFTLQNSPNTFLPYYNGGYTYSNFNNFLSDAGTLNLADGNPVIPFTEPDFGLYVQDDWKVSASLTVNLGFRYEFFDQAVNKLHDETVARETGSSPFWDTSLALSKRTYGYTNRNWRNLEPRFGFAYNPAGHKSLVIRGAYGIQYDPSFYNIFLNSATAAPVVNLGSISCSGSCLPSGGVSGANVRSYNLSKIPTGVDPSYRSQTNNPSTFVNPRAQTYSFGVQYELRNAVVGVSYVGNHVSRQFLSVDANPYLLPVAEAFPNYVSTGSLCSDTTSSGYGRLSCANGNVRTRNNNAFSNYNSLQVQLQSRNYHGATVNASYTYSRAIDNADEIFSATSAAGTSSSPAFAENPLQTDTPERGVANYSYPNLASVGLNYLLPAYKSQRGLVGRLLGGYEVSTTWAFNNGESWTPQQGLSPATVNDTTSNSALNTSSYCDSKFNTSFIGADSCRPVLSNPAAAVSSVGIYVIDPNSSFTTAGTGYYSYTSTDANGNLNAPINKSQVHWLYNNRAYANLVNNPFPGSARNITRGQSFNNVDAAIIKNVQVREGIGVKLYLNAFNVLNHAFLGNPDTFLDDSAFGSNAYNTGNYQNPGGGGTPASRYLQLGGKVTF